jgi:predicted dehydrogenase
VQKYFRAHKYLRDIIREKKLGKLCAITETRNINYFPNRPRWFLNKEQAGGGILMNYGAHTLDKLFFLTGLSVDSVMATGNNFLTDDSVEASAQVLLRLSDGSSAALTYSGCHTPTQYDTFFYFTDGVVKIQGCAYVWIAEGAKPLAQVELEGTDDIMGEQLAEFVKMIRGEENGLVTPNMGKEVISVLERAFAQFNDNAK